MDYHIKQQDGKWVVYTNDNRNYREWIFNDRESAIYYLSKCKGETA